MKFTRKNIPRGVKLVKQMVFDAVDSIASSLSSLGIDKENFAESRVPWQVSLNFPVIGERFYSVNTTNAGSQTVELCAPFIALPPQDQYNSHALQNDSTVRLTLDSIMISFDQRAEASGILDIWKASGPASYAGGLSKDAARGYNINLRLSEKVPVAFGGVAPFLSDRDLWSATYSQIAALTPDGSLNPIIWENLGIQLDPYKTYILRISCPDLYTNNACFVSFNAVLNCFSTLMQHDSGVNVQNIPVQSHLVPTPATVPVKNPSADDPIDCGPATNTDGTLDDPLVRLDQLLQKRLRFGIGPDSSLPVTSHGTDDAGYEMIAVPMFQNPGLIRRIISGQLEYAPFVDSNAPEGTLLIDRRIVPLPYPVVIHHVVAVVSYAAPYAAATGLTGWIPQLGTGQRPSSETLTNQVGVALGTGLRGDLAAYQQVAFVEWAPSDNPDIDAFKQASNGQLSYPGSYPPDPNLDWDYELRSVPIVGAGGHGVVPQGKPVYAGRASSVYMERTPIAQPRGGVEPSKVQGCEQFLQVDWRINDDGGLAGPSGGGAAPTDFDVYAGEGGHWVLILCKKMLVGGTNELEV